MTWVWSLHPVDAALQHIVYVRARNGVAQSRLRSEPEAGVGTEDEDVLEEDQRADHVFGDALDKDVLRRVAAVILKRQNHEGWALFGGCPAISRSPVLEQKGRPPAER